MLFRQAPFCLPVWIAEGSLVKFANEFPESLPCADSVDFSFICLLFRAKCIAEVYGAFVKSRHFYKVFINWSLVRLLLLPGKDKIWRENSACSLSPVISGRRGRGRGGCATHASKCRLCSILWSVTRAYFYTTYRDLFFTSQVRVLAEPSGTLCLIFAPC